MKQISKLFFTTSCSLFIFGCSSNGDCTKTITIPEQVVQTSVGTSYRPAYDMEVACDYVITPIKEAEKLENFTYEVLVFEYTADTGHNTSRFKYQIKLNNPNNFTIKGVPKLTIDSDGVVVSTYGVASEPFCTEIGANSSCTIILDKEYPLNINVGLTKSIKLVNVEYILNN